ncbi:MAG: class I SAM-dependent methyltransferase [Litorilinea sp.]
MNRFWLWAYAWACERLYDELAGVYDPVSALVSLGQWDNWRRLALQYARGNTVLELGFGTGQLLCPLAARHAQVIGIDRSPAMVRQARKRIARNSYPNLYLLQGAAEKLPLYDHSVDTIISTFPAPYILAEATLREAHRVLRHADSNAVGQLVVVGLGVIPCGSSLRARLLRRVPIFYATPSAARHNCFVQRVTAQGFHAQIHEEVVGETRVMILCAQPMG